MLSSVTRLLASSFAALLLLAACTQDSAPGAKSDEGGSKSAEPATVEAMPEVGPDGQPLGRLHASEFIDLRKLVNKTPAQVQAVLGEPSETGGDRVSCVRFVPERVFFACEQQVHLYEHPQFESIRVEFEDGHAATVALAGLPGEGSFDPIAALAAVGVELPGEPNHDNPPLTVGQPGEVVDRWEWGNSRARLLIDDLQHRVRLTTINGEWRRAKLEIIVNHPLTPDQQARVRSPR
jgi:hypothetical protein